MKVKEYIRLGKISIKSRKKSTRNTVRGISFGLVMLIPIVFFTLAFYLDLTQKINQTRTVASFYVSGTESTGESVYNKDNGMLTLGAGDLAAVAARTEEVEEVVYAEYYNVGEQAKYGEGANNSQIAVGAASKTLGLIGNNGSGNRDDGSANANVNVKVIDTERSNGAYVTKGIEEDLKKAGKKVLAAGEGFGTTGTKGKAMVSSVLLKELGVSAQDAIGRELTLTLYGQFQSSSNFANGNRYGYYLDNDANPNNSYTGSADDLSENAFAADVLSGFEIVGVVSEDYFKLNSFTKSEPQIWITGESVYERTGGVRSVKYLPALKSGESENESGNKNYYQIVTYSATGTEGIATLAERAAEEKAFFPAIPAVTFGTASKNGGSYYFGAYPESPYTSMTVQCKDYNAATKVASLIDGVFNRLSGESATGSYTSYNLATDAYQNFSMLNTVGGYLMLVMYTFGGIIFFATLLNLYNSVNYSVQARKNYIGMMRAIGAKKSMIPKLYFVEILLIFRKSLLWVLIFGGGISYGIKFAIDMLFKQDAAALLGATLSLNFAYFFVALALVFVVVFLIAFLFSRVACRAVTHKGILDVLSDDK